MKFMKIYPGERYRIYRRGGTLAWLVYCVDNEDTFSVVEISLLSNEVYDAGRYHRSTEDFWEGVKTNGHTFEQIKLDVLK
jgi:hypothetical protein